MSYILYLLRNWKRDFHGVTLLISCLSAVGEPVLGNKANCRVRAILGTMTHTSPDSRNVLLGDGNIKPSIT